MKVILVSDGCNFVVEYYFGSRREFRVRCSIVMILFLKNTLSFDISVTIIIPFSSLPKPSFAFSARRIGNVGSLTIHYI